MIEQIVYQGQKYPAFQSTGNAARFAMPFAKEVCVGTGFDIGCHCKEWALPGAIPVDLRFEDGYDAYCLPALTPDYIFSSHCIEHLPDWVGALKYWHNKLRTGGVLFLYLPNMDKQLYWQPWSNRKHLHYICPRIMEQYFTGMIKLWDNVKVTTGDLNDSFYCIAQKR